MGTVIEAEQAAANAELRAAEEALRARLSPAQDKWYLTVEEAHVGCAMYAWARGVEFVLAALPEHRAVILAATEAAGLHWPEAWNESREQRRVPWLRLLRR